ncbi:unnamed protein product [Heligmosomoides polygyrus]|uniref:Uncharacterized protein n=1 Tax=Heligmosomoides polygyrus TaxID=6339 RepID=A0A183G8F4_HELPZ|nr:unnamed protein product [Heligmosomoides polygyrus]
MDEGEPTARNFIKYRGELPFDVLRECGSNEALRIEDPLVRKLVEMQKRIRMTDEEILNAVKKDIFPTDLPSLVDAVISAQNAEERERRSSHLKSTITLRLLRDRVKTVENALSVVKKKVYQKSSDETLTASEDFGALDVPSEDFTIPPSSYGPGGDLPALYTRLQRRSRVPSSTSEYVNFFNKFIHHVVSEMYSRNMWPDLRCGPEKKKPVRRLRIGTGHNTNFRWNMKGQEAAEQSTSSTAVDNDTIPSRPSS